MNRKAIHHVEYVIAVTIFLAALLFLIYFSNISSTKEKLSVSYLEEIFREEVEINIAKLVLKVSTTTGSCYNVSLNSNLPADETKIFIRSDSHAVPFNITNGRFLINSASTNFIIYFSETENFTSERIFSDQCDIVEYNYSILYTEKMIFKEKLEKINYTEIKSKLGRDFLINVTSGDVVIFNTTKPLPFNVPVASKEFHAKMINKTAEIIDVKVNLFIW